MSLSYTVSSVLFWHCLSVPRSNYAFWSSIVGILCFSRAAFTGLYVFWSIDSERYPSPRYWWMSMHRICRESGSTRVHLPSRVFRVLPKAWSSFQTSSWHLKLWKGKRIVPDDCWRCVVTSSRESFLFIITRPFPSVAVTSISICESSMVAIASLT